MLARCIVAALVVVLFPTNALFALVPPEINREEIGAFRSFFLVPSFGQIVVPTIVSVPVENLTFTRTDFAVYETETGEYVKPAYITNETTLKTPATITGVETGEVYSALADADVRTMAQFNVEQDGFEGVTTLMLTHEKAVLSSQLDLSLDRNVNLPETIAVSAVVNGREQVVRATSRVTGTQISFPPTTAAVWYVTMTYRQPLRLSKVSLQNEAAGVATSKQVRFLAQPNRSYIVYYDADKAVPAFGRESGNLVNGAMVTTGLISPRISTPNPNYTMVDRDRDGVADTNDNCPAVPNEDQTDIDSSGTGDACEDFDRDGVSNAIDNCINLPNGDQLDEDGDLIGDVCDDAESRLTEKYKFIPWAALGLALVMIVGMFAIVARRTEEVATEETTATGE
jgi:Thrombospondin type 3 repeat